ncbi:MAG: carbamate kinase [Thermodesulfobacteriota bacterium]
MGRELSQEVLLVALGGNALIRKGQVGTVEEQFENLRVPMRQIALLSDQYRIIITHGNGPQVGHLLLQQECCRCLPRLPLEILVAQTQGQIGYMIESTLDSELMSLGRDQDKLLVSLISYVVVDPEDPAFLNPTKPIGPVYPQEKVASLPFPTMKTSKGYRRVVASPRPVTIVEKREIGRLIQMGFIVICCGGGGIPVIREGRTFAGVDAVIDKDLASARLAQEVDVDIFLIATDVPALALNYGASGERFLRRLGTAEARRLLAEGHFQEGSMAPKVEACVEFLESGGKRAIICSLEDILEALDRKAGTEFFRDD